ncbi:hypothetical protein ACA910_022684 [Epithemia clementina (nom. ined.)]
MLAQGSVARLNCMRRTLMHCNNLVFRPNDDLDEAQGRREPMSLKKFAKGDACWSTHKTILGWNIDSLQRTVKLPAHRRERLLQLLDATKHKKSVPLKTFQQRLGELRSMAMGLPGARGLFSHLQSALSTHRTYTHVRLTKPARNALADFELLALGISSRPTRISEIIPSRHPTFVGVCDAAPVGMGGIWLPPPHDPRPPLLWRWPTPTHLTQHITTDTTSGTVTINDLELVAILIHADILASTFDVRKTTLATCCDNVAAVAWSRRGSITSDGPSAYILRAISLHQRAHRYLHSLSHMPGQANSIADDASCLHHLSDQLLLQPFQYTLSTDATLAPSPTITRHHFLDDLRLATQTARESVSSSRAHAVEKVWLTTWVLFCQELGFHPLLTYAPDKIPILQVFATRVRDGRASRSRRPVHADTVADELLHVAKTFTSLGARDPRLTDSGQIDPRLSALIKGMKNRDPAPNRVQPIPVQLLHSAHHLATLAGDPASLACIDMAWIAFFYLLRAGEYCLTSDNLPICGRHISLCVGSTPINPFECPLANLNRVTTLAITFENQKNRQRGEMVAHACSCHSYACPTRLLARRIAYLCSHGADTSSPLCSYFLTQQRHLVTSTNITTLL